MAQRLLRFSNFVNVFSQFCYYHPLEKDSALYFNKLELPSPKLEYFVPSLVEIGPVVQRKTDKYRSVMFTGQYGQRTYIDQISSLEPSAQVSQKAHELLAPMRKNQKERTSNSSLRCVIIYDFMCTLFIPSLPIFHMW